MENYAEYITLAGNIGGIIAGLYCAAKGSIIGLKKVAAITKTDKDDKIVAKIEKYVEKIDGLAEKVQPLIKEFKNARTVKTTK